MRTSTKVWVIVALLASVSPLAAQRPRAERPGAGRDGMDRMGPMGRMGLRGMGEARSLERVIGIALERRDSLGLSAEQMDGLEALRADVEQRNAELRQQMEQVHEETASKRAEVRERMRGLMETVRTERRAFRARFDEILTDEQREGLAPVLRGQRATRRRDGLRRPPGPGRRGPALGRGRLGPVARAYQQGWRDGLRAGARFGGRPRR